MAPRIEHQAAALPSTAFPAVSLRQVSFFYDHTKPILTNASIDIQQNELVVLEGISGLGKSSVLELILNLLKPTNNTTAKVLIYNQDVSTMSTRAISQQLTYVSQNHILLDKK